MKHPFRSRIGGKPTLALALGAMLLMPWGAASAADDDYAGDDMCVACHEDVVKAFRLSPHSKVPGWTDAGGCESCHGPGQAHVESGGDASLIRNLAELPAGEASETCIDCHKREAHTWRFGQSLHAMNDVSCTSCHNPHGTSDGMLRAPKVELCQSCHESIAAQFQVARTHPMPDDGDGCISCHNPHGTKNPRMFSGFGNETCLDCHIDKRGPFVFNHDVSIVDGCMACHEMHGSTNRHLNRREQRVNLCYQCHTGTSTPSFHNFGRFLREKCTACHTAIHGSNTNEYFLEE